MNNISSYSKIFALGNKWVTDIFDDPVIIEEKVDGSQISFVVLEGELLIRSRGAQIDLESPPKIFNKAVATIVELKYSLRPGLVYRGEYLSKPKHNTLAYDRVPRHNIILFDVCTQDGLYLTHPSVSYEARQLDLEVVPLLFDGDVTSFLQVQDLLDTDSILGGQKIEGVVIKNYWKFTTDGKTMMAKCVSANFQEKHQSKGKKRKPIRSDVVENIARQYCTKARWQKSVQHLREAGQLLQSPKDIGNIIKEVKSDIREECEEEIKDQLFDYFWSQIERQVIRGLPEWYKEKLTN